MTALIVTAVFALYVILMVRIYILESKIKRYKLQAKVAKNKSPHGNVTCADHDRNSDKIKDGNRNSYIDGREAK